MRNMNSIDKRSFEFLTEKRNVRVPHFYLLPKIHKLGKILENMDPVNYDKSIKLNIPGRPIISQCNGPTERLGKYLDFFWC
jgi:hypothetical protein